jgi:outer membrane receptor for ferrienterochelin and colicin
MNTQLGKLLLSGLLLFAIQDCLAQRQVTGTVSGMEKGGKVQLLTGAVLSTLDQKTGTQTDETGSFTITVPDDAMVLYISYVGFMPDTLEIPADNKMDIVLQETKSMKEVVVRKRRKGTEMSMLTTLKTEIISERELLKAACCNLSESFETTPSVDVAFTDAVSGYKQIQMLGLAGPYTLITRENIPDTRGLASITGLTFTPGTWIEGMQLSKGTGSVVNGYESVAGQINIELQKPFEDKEPKWLLNAYQSTQGRSEGNLVYRHQFNKALSSNLMLHGKSQWARVDMNGDGFMDQPLDKQFVGLNRWFWFGPKGWEVQGGVKGSYISNTGGQKDYKEGGEQIVGKPWGYEMDIERIEGWAKIGKMFQGMKGTSIGLQLSGVHHGQDALYGTRTYGATQNAFYTNLIFQTLLGNTNHVLKTGLSNMIDNYNENFGAQQFQRNEVVPGAFAEYSYSFKEKLNVVAGLRGDYHNIFGAFATPRLHVRYAPFKQTAIRASVGRAQRTANIISENMSFLASNRNYIFQSTEAGKPYGMNPEVAWNYGVNLTQKFQLDYRDGAISLDFYHTDFENQVVVDMEDAHSVKFYNLDGKSFANSFQAQFDYELIHNLDLRLAYRWYDVKSTYSGVLKDKPLIAAHRAFANVGYETKNKWKFDYTIQWIGSKRVPSLHDHVNGGVGQEFQSPSFWQMNAQVSKGWGENFEVYVGGENLANYMQHHAIIGAQNPYDVGFDASAIWGPVMGRNIYGGFRYKIK